MLILPSTKLTNESIMSPQGHKIKVMEALRQCRLKYFHDYPSAASASASSAPPQPQSQPPASAQQASASSSQAAAASTGGAGVGGRARASGTSISGINATTASTAAPASSRAHHSHVASEVWTNVTVVGRRGVRIDAAYFCPQEQLRLHASEQRWLLWLLGNGEVYEFLLPELRAIALESGLNVLAFNYRGVGSSKGDVSSAADLVTDAVMVLDFMQERLGAAPMHVLVFGHSIGGAIGTVARACHSPSGPVVVERSFSSLADAAWGLFNLLLQSALDTSLTVPHFVVSGLLASVFKGAGTRGGGGERRRLVGLSE